MSKPPVPPKSGKQAIGRIAPGVQAAGMQAGGAKARGRQAATPRDPVAEALLEYQSPTAALIARPVAAFSHVITWVIAVAFFVLLALAVLVPIDREVFAAGKVTATTGNITVQPLDVSLVRSVAVREGQLVHAGDVLAELDPTFAQADAGSLDSQVASLQAEVERLRAEAENRPYLPDGSPAGQLQAILFAQRHAEHSFKLEQYSQQIESARVKVAQGQADVAAFTERLKLATEVEAKRRELERLQVGSQFDRMQAADARLNIQQQLDAASSQLTGVRRDLDALLAERNDYVQHTAADTSQKLTEQGRLLDDARQQLNKAKLRRKLVQLKVDRDAVVLRVSPVSVGTVMQSGQEFMELVPLDAPLQIEAVVDGRDVGFVRVGDPVTVKFDTFPYVLYGTGTGTVRSISPDSFKDPTAPPSKDQLQKQSQEAATSVLFFRAVISIDEVRLHDLPEGARIVPGMPVQADIRIGQRTMIDYLMSRFIPPSTDRMREP